MNPVLAEILARGLAKAGSALTEEQQPVHKAGSFEAETAMPHHYQDLLQEARSIWDTAEEDEVPEEVVEETAEPVAEEAVAPPDKQDLDQYSEFVGRGDQYGEFVREGEDEEPSEVPTEEFAIEEAETAPQGEGAEALDQGEQSIWEDPDEPTPPPSVDVNAEEILTPAAPPDKQELDQYGEFVGKGEDEEKGKPPSGKQLTELAKAARAADNAALWSKLLGGVIGTLGDVGRVSPGAGPDTFGGSAKPLVQGVQEGISENREAKVAVLAAEFEDDRRQALELKIEGIERTPNLTEWQKQQLIDKAVRNYRAEINSMQRTLRLGRPAYQSVAVSDERKKNVKPNGYIIARLLRSDIELSDEDWKLFEDADPQEVAAGFIKLGAPWKGHELQFVHDTLNQRDDYDKWDKDLKSCSIWNPETLLGYARWIRNSRYTYKPEAVEIDPSIDPEEEHIGPMAQEIEKVNPACIEETPEGVKTVDTGRLALMNAGAIGDLARQAMQQEKKIEQLETALESA